MRKRLVAAGLLASASAAAVGTLSAGNAQVITGGLGQGSPIITREHIALAGDRIRADRWYDAAATNPNTDQVIRRNRAADMDLLLTALKNPFPELRAAALREMGRFELAQNAAVIAAYLGDPSDVVQRAAADALVQTLWDKQVAEAAPAVELLDQLILQGRNALTIRAFWMALAELPLDASTAQKYERRFVNEIKQSTELRTAALEALLTMTHRRRGRPLLAQTEQYAMEMARRGLDAGDPQVMVGLTSYGATIRYLEILQAAQADADDIAFDAATFFCRRSAPGCGDDIRRLGVELLNPSNPAHVPALLQAAADRKDMRTAATAIRQLLTSPEVTRCRLLDLAQKTPAEPDVIAALGDDPAERKGECGDWSPELALTQQAQSLVSATRGTDWVGPTAALEALAKRAPDAARPILTDYAAGHILWQVRVAAARVAGRLRERDVVATLATDNHPNVKAAALEALNVSGHGGLVEAAKHALANPDYHVVRTAATVLKGQPDGDALIALFDALGRLTRQYRDTTRRARLALLQRIEEFSPGGAPDTPARVHALETLLKDPDPTVARAAGDFLQKTSTSPVEVKPNRFSPGPPTPMQLLTLPPCVTMFLEGEDSFVIVLNRRVAPVAVARFLEAAGKGYYNNSMFYRDDPAMTVFGNPAPNDEGGWSKFARDEPGTPVRFMSVMMLNHGPDTVDGRLAIQWRRNPELDRRATVIGQAFPVGGSGLDGVELGKLVEKIEVGGEARLTPAGADDPCNPRRPW